MSHSEPEHNRRPEGSEPDEPFPTIGEKENQAIEALIGMALHPNSEEIQKRVIEKLELWTVYEHDGKWVLMMVDVGMYMPDELTARSVMTTHNAALETERKDHEREVFDNWNKAAQEIEKLREILRACKPLAHAWAAEELEDRIEDALPKE
jgi:hypothetical protein